jgi:metal-sulfur cluster biosynthetic enzyme
MATPTQDQIIDSLRSVIDPELRRDIVELEMVRSVEIHDNGVVDVMVSLTTPGCPIRSHFQTSTSSPTARSRPWGASSGEAHCPRARSPRCLT